MRAWYHKALWDAYLEVSDTHKLQKYLKRNLVLRKYLYKRMVWKNPHETDMYTETEKLFLKSVCITYCITYITEAVYITAQWKQQLLSSLNIQHREVMFLFSSQISGDVSRTARRSSLKMLRNQCKQNWTHYFKKEIVKMLFLPWLNYICFMIKRCLGLLWNSKFRLVHIRHFTQPFQSTRCPILLYSLMASHNMRTQHYGF